MERLKERLLLAHNALSSFNEVLQQPYSKIIRDAAIQRFEFTLEALWKLAQRYLILKEGIESGSPKGVSRACFQAQLLTEQETQTLLESIDDRNLTVHTYNEKLAEEIFQRLAKYQPVFIKLYNSIEQKS